MELKDEIKKYWKESPIWAKVVWVLSVFFASSSIASLSDLVFAWKGFILDGIEFYRAIISPIKDYFGNLLGIQIKREQADLIVFTGFFVSAYRKFIASRWLVSKPNIKITSLLFSINVLFWLVTMLLISASILEMLHIAVDILLAFYLFHMLQYPVGIFLFDKLPPENKFHKTIGALMLKAYANNKTRFFIVYYSPIIVAIALLFVAAAVNSGLTR